MLNGLLCSQSTAEKATPVRHQKRYIVASELQVLTWFIVTQTCLRGHRNVLAFG